MDGIPPPPPPMDEDHGYEDYPPPPVVGSSPAVDLSDSDNDDDDLEYDLPPPPLPAFDSVEQFKEYDEKARSNSADSYDDGRGSYTSYIPVSSSELKSYETARKDKVEPPPKVPVSTPKVPISTPKVPISTARVPISTPIVPVSTLKAPVSTPKKYDQPVQMFHSVRLNPMQRAVVEGVNLNVAASSLFKKQKDKNVEQDDLAPKNKPQQKTIKPEVKKINNNQISNLANLLGSMGSAGGPPAAQSASAAFKPGLTKPKVNIELSGNNPIVTITEMEEVIDAEEPKKKVVSPPPAKLKIGGAKKNTEKPNALPKKSSLMRGAFNTLRKSLSASSSKNRISDEEDYGEIKATMKMQKPKQPTQPPPPINRPEPATVPLPNTSRMNLKKKSSEEINDYNDFKSFTMPKELLQQTAPTKTPDKYVAPPSSTKNAVDTLTALESKFELPVISKPVEKTVVVPAVKPVAPTLEDTVGSEYDKEVLHWLNIARTTPKALIPELKIRLTQFEPNSKNVVLSKTERLMTNEGTTAVEVAIQFLESKEAVKALEWNDAVALACKDHVDDCGAKGQYTHKLDDGSQPTERVLRRLGEEVGAAAESIKFQSNDAKGAVLDLIIDDGVPTRGNRNNIFGNWDLCGSFTGAHKLTKTMTTILFVQSKQFSDDIIERLVSEIDADIKDPDNWVQKQQKILFSGSEITVTNIYTLSDGTIKEIEITREI